MADETNGAPKPEAPQPRLQILTQYIRDVSFENIAVQKGLVSEGKPEVRVGVNLDAQKRGDDRYEVALKVKVDSKLPEGPVFILELDYAGLFVVQNVPDEQLHPLLMIECPRLIFPFARQILADAIRNGGFPQLLLDPVDFARLYQQRMQQQAQAQAAAAGKPS